MPNNVEKKNIVTIAIIVVIFTLIWLVTSIMSMGNDDKLKIDMNKIKENITSDRLVKDYKIFALIENVSECYVNSLITEKTNNTYKLLTNELKDKYKYSDYKESITKATEENFNSKEENRFYTTDACLKRAYIVEEKATSLIVAAEIRTVTEKNMLVGFYIDKKTQTYKVCYLEV